MILQSIFDERRELQFPSLTSNIFLSFHQTLKIDEIDRPNFWPSFMTQKKLEKKNNRDTEILDRQLSLTTNTRQLEDKLEHIKLLT